MMIFLINNESACINESINSTNTYKFKDGTIVSTKLSLDEYLRRYKLLDTLRVLTEGYEYGTGHDIYIKAYRAENVVVDFTGIIRLSSYEKEFLQYILEENEYISSRDKECLEYFIRR